MGKHIICSGCSFTRQEKRIGLDGDSTNFYMDDPSMWRWPHWIQKLYPKKIYDDAFISSESSEEEVKIIKKKKKIKSKTSKKLK